MFWLVVVLVMGSVAAGLAQSADAAPRTPWGAPDLHGIWDYRTTTPFERPEGLEDTAVVAGDAAETFVRQRHASDERRRERVLNADWNDVFEIGLADGRTSLIVDPPDGRLPPLTPEASTRRDNARARRQAGHGPEDLSLTQRCVMYKAAPLRWSPYNNNLQIFQTRDNVVVHHEMIHEALIIPLDGRPQLPETIRLWRGDARGRWEGDTLVVDTVNRHARWGWPGGIPPMPNMRVTERFTRVDRNTLRYEFTVDDPETYTAPWSVVWPMRRSEQPLFEYACHEGNYGMALTLTGARAKDATPSVK